MSGFPGFLNGRVVIWDVESRLPLQEHALHKRTAVHQVAISPDGNLVASVSKFGRGELIVWDGASDSVVIEEREANYKWSVAFSHDGSKVVVGSGLNIEIWDVRKRELVKRIPGHTSAVWDLAVHDNLLASASWDRTVRLWDLETGAPLAVLPGHEDWVLGVAFSKDGSRLASCSRDLTIRIWDVAAIQRGEEFKSTCVLRAHTTSITGVSFSPLDDRSVFEFLCAAVTAHFRSKEAPSLLPDSS